MVAQVCNSGTGEAGAGGSYSSVSAWITDGDSASYNGHTQKDMQRSQQNPSLNKKRVI